MIKFESVFKKWYHCPCCLNYSIEPMKCCGQMMIEEESEESESRERKRNNDYLNSYTISKTPSF